MLWRILLSFFFLASTANAQPSRIVGTVLESGTLAPLPGAHVVLEGMDNGAVTNTEGHFVLENLEPGTYTLVATSVGFEGVREGVIVRGGETVELGIILHEAAIDVGEVVVSARETLTGLGVVNIAGSAHYIGPEVLKRFATNDVTRVLREVPGVNIQEEDGYGLRPNVGLRGTGVERSSKITLMEDGVLMAPAPYAAPSAYYFPTIGRMDGVEIRTGSSQIKYGPYTTGGAMNLIAAGIPSDLSLRAAATLGPNGQRTLYARAGDTIQNVGGFNLGFVAEGYLDNVDGFKTLRGPGGNLVEDYNTGFDKGDLFARFRMSTDGNASIFQSLTFTAGYTDEISNETYLGLTTEDFASSPYVRYAGSQVDEMDAEHIALRARHVALLSDRIDLTTTVYRNTFSRNWYKLDAVSDGIADDPIDGGMTDRSFGIASILSDPSEFGDELAAIRGDGSGMLYVKANNRDYTSQGIQSVTGVRLGEASGFNALVEVGLRVHADEMDRFQWVDGYTMVDGTMSLSYEGTPGTDSNRLESASAVATFAQAEVNFGRLTVTPGVRYEHIALRRQDYGKADPERTGVDLSIRANTVDVVIPGVGLLYNATHMLRFFGGMHRGFAPPDSRPETNPESSVNLEAGFRYGAELLTLQAVGFFNAYSNLLGSDLAAAGGGGSTDQFNGGEVDVMGAEIALTADLARPANLAGWSLPVRFAYTFTDAQFNNNFVSEFEGWGSVEEGDELPYLAKQQLALSVGVERGPVSVNLAGSYVSAMRTEAGQGDIHENSGTDARFVLDASTDWEFRSGLSMFGRVHNLMDVTYVVARRPAGLRPGLPRTIAVGVRARL